MGWVNRMTSQLIFRMELIVNAQNFLFFDQVELILSSLQPISWLQSKKGSFVQKNEAWSYTHVQYHVQYTIIVLTWLQHYIPTKNRAFWSRGKASFCTRIYNS